MPHRLLRAGAAVCFAGIALIAVGCSDPATSAGESGTPSASYTGAGLQVTLAVVPGVVAPDSTFTVRLTLRNTAGTPAVLSLSCTSPLAYVGIRGAEQRTLLYLNQTGCYTAITGLTLAAGETRTIEVALAAVDARELGRARPLSPGRYVVDAQPSLRVVNGESIVLPTLQAEFTVR